MKKYKSLKTSIPLLILSFGAGYFFAEEKQWLLSSGDAQIKVCFTPHKPCLPLILKEIQEAKEEILVQSYAFTSKAIAEALVEATHRGVRVEIGIDKSQLEEKNSQLSFLEKENVPVKILNLKGIAHSKVMVIDEKKVITGSYNWTKAAEHRNSENLLLLENRELASHYIQNFRKNILLFSLK